jgi:glutamate N-acetyltransferase / amino-acid N-acetyltransferase
MSGWFESRWIDLPPVATMLDDPGALPAGFFAAGLSAGIKAAGDLDVGVILCETADCVSAARFCVSGVLAAPVVLCQEECELSGLRAVVANSGNANAATGEAGLEQARLVQQAAAMEFGLQTREVAVASTGVIGVLLPGGHIARAVDGARPSLSATGGSDFAAAIRTTDAIDKHVSLSIGLPSGIVKLSAQCKGAGMISPRFATMLCFIQTDAALSPETAELLLGVTVKRSFDRVSVDGQLSTNDTVLLMASGASGVVIEPESEDELAFGAVLDGLLRELALRMVIDGEGAKRVGRVHVRGGDSGDVDAVARAVANSPLVKAALFGGDPNWGRVAQAVGAAMAGSAPLRFDISIEGIEVCAGGAAVDFDREELTRAVSGHEVDYAVTLPGSGAETEVFFSDLSYDYVKINADYTT